MGAHAGVRTPAHTRSRSRADPEGAPLTFRIACSSGKHTLARVEVPEPFLVPGQPAVTVAARCIECKEPVLASLARAVVDARRLTPARSA
jgi:hypothetical protein